MGTEIRSRTQREHSELLTTRWLCGKGGESIKDNGQSPSGLAGMLLGKFLRDERDRNQVQAEEGGSDGKGSFVVAVLGWEGLSR